jgi:histone-lysine N-methyltransferase SETD8
MIHTGVARLMNHSRRAPNLRAAKVIDHLHRPHLCLYALRDLAPGEELLFDYGERDKVTIAAFPWLDST